MERSPILISYLLGQRLDSWFSRVQMSFIHHENVGANFRNRLEELSITDMMIRGMHSEAIEVLSIDSDVGFLGIIVGIRVL